MLKEIRIKNWKQFESKKEDACPYHKFFMYCAKKIGKIPEGKKINVSSVFLNPKTYKKLEKLVEQWAKATTRLKGRAFKKALAYHNLQYSPAESNDCKEDVVYIKEDFFI
jgi:hypothetical protein